MKAAKAQKEARDRAETGDRDGAKRLLTEAAEELRKVAPGSPRADELLAQAEETRVRRRDVRSEIRREDERKSLGTTRGSADAAALSRPLRGGLFKA